MITLLTGLPGNGKTLRALSMIKELSEKENRPVFYAGIKDLMLPWTEIDATKWFECPTGAIIVIDECQTVFRPRSIGKEPPDYVAKLETHRHQGIDIFLITQHPLLADSAIRRLVGRHLHLIRIFGTQAATIHEWASCRDNCDKPAGRTDSIKTKWIYDKKAFEYYKSAELHTVKRNIPKRIYFFILAPVLLIAAVLYIKHFTQKQTEKGATAEQSTGIKPAPIAANSGALKKASYRDALEDAKQYVYEDTPRVEGLPHTAPKYDELTKPVEVPVPAGCVVSQSQGCKCFTQQATPIKMPEAICLDIVKHGFFEDFERSKRQKNDKTEQQQIAQAAPVEEDAEQKSQWLTIKNKPVERMKTKADKS